jgi:superfamily II DNA/RNA helicase
MEYKNNLGPYLVIVPLSTLSNWVNEFQKWCPSAHLICYKGIPAQRKEIYREKVKNGHFNVLLTTYEYIIKDKASLRKIQWQYAIVDEGHRMKNAASKFAKTLSSQYETKFRLLLTGTPLMNDLSELWSLLNFLLPTIFNSVDTFDQWFNRPFAQFGSNKDNDAEANVLSNEERMFIIHRLHELLRPFMLRRVKSEVLDQLPEKVEKILRCELSSWQKELYKQISLKAAAENNKDDTGPQPAGRGLNNAVMQLRKVCNHPYLFSPQGYHINENVIRSSTKVELLDRMLPKLRAAGHRVLLFTQMTAVMTILEDYFSYRGYLSLRLDGSTPAEEREKRMYKFNAPDSPYFIFLLSTRAGGLGLNLTAANTVIIFDSDWNPMMDLQAQDRAHRIGQRSDVSVFRMVTKSPVEEKILSRATEKLNMADLVVEAGQFNKGSVENDNSLERKRMMEVLLVDFETNANANKNDLVPVSNRQLEEEKTPDIPGSEDGEIDDVEDDDDDDNNSEASNENDLNDLLSNNENDYQLYKSLDKIQAAATTKPVDVSLFTSAEDVPDWIKYPSGKKDPALEDTSVPGSGPRKRKEVAYDDGLTEKQFLKMMDKQFDNEVSARQEKKSSKRDAKSAAGVPAVSGGRDAVAIATANSDLTDWAFRKLLSCAKTVVALKEPSTKRRICEIFLEKPSPEQFPDYYEIVLKPIAINDILRKCRGKLYGNLQEFLDDWKLMFANASQFNGADSWVAEDGKTIKKELDRVLKKNGFAEEGEKPKSPPKPKKKKIVAEEEVIEAEAKPKSLPKKKKFRIKLSLKNFKNEENAVEGTGEGDDGKPSEPVKKKRKKIKQDTLE